MCHKVFRGHIRLVTRCPKRQKAARRTTIRDVLALVHTTEAHAFEPFIHVERAALARLTGDEPTHERELREAHRLFVEMGATGHAERIASLLAESVG